MMNSARASTIAEHPRVLIVDDRAEMAAMVAEGLADRGFDASAADSGALAIARLEAGGVDAVVTDIRMRPVDGFEVLARSRALAPDRPVLVMTAFSAIDGAIDAMRRGAFQYLAKPFNVEELAMHLEHALEVSRLRQENAGLRRSRGERPVYGGLAGDSPAMQRVFEFVDRVGPSRAPVLVRGETGTGKSLVARAIHEASSRAGLPFVPMNCAACPEALLERELFGDASATSAAGAGVFGQAHYGTLFLDSIEELPAGLQGKLLRAIESGKVRPAGATTDREVDVRVVAASSADLPEAVARGAFRDDLFRCLAAASIEVPPLRARREDIPGLLARALAEARARHPQSTLRTLSNELHARLLDHEWPGNFRELTYTVERLVVLARRGEATLADLPSAMVAPLRPGTPGFTGDIVSMREMQRAYASWAVSQLGGVQLRAAARLEIGVNTLTRLLREGSMDRDEDLQRSG